ncbi:MAG TPA: aldehyde dehydrogenase family protein [Candidatus Paceibacterota bacterium]|jgi:lysyl-tRNA synthetase class 1|nr:aldehyde dehydrogenase family protein [Candidatus Paceibacterota bacterium]
MTKLLNKKPRYKISNKYLSYTPITFSEVDSKAKKLAKIIETHSEELANILLKYESYEVVQDELARTLDLLKNLKENKEYFKLRIGSVASFLPRNQPLYSFCCFVVVPSLMASEVHFRIPSNMRSFFPKILDILKIKKFFPNIIVSPLERLEFLSEHSARLVNSKTEESRPVTDAVIFTGTTDRANQLRLVFDRKTLFIANGAGHNPVIISKDADLFKAIEAVMDLVLYNQGQDCSAPNAILVQKTIYPRFMELLYKDLAKVKIGPYRDRSCKVGPISDPKDLKRIEELIVDNHEWLDKKAGGIIHTAEAIVEPTIISKPLKEGGNYSEFFAPIFFIQKYERDNDLSLYFENQRYAKNAMHVTLYGNSIYAKKLVGKTIVGKILHNKKTFLNNTHLHAPGIERGTQAYGGYGHGTSSISIDGKITPMPTLPQRDIYERIAKPILVKKRLQEFKKSLGSFASLEKRDVQKLLKLTNHKPEFIQSASNDNGKVYLDLYPIKDKKVHYISASKTHVYKLLEKPNGKYISSLKEREIKMIRKLNNLLEKKSSMNSDEFSEKMYDLPKKKGANKGINIGLQAEFFHHIYELLFNKKYGPRIGHFLYDADPSDIDKLLYV